MDARLRDMIRQMNVAMRNMKFYAADHPTATASVQKSYDALMQIVREQGTLGLGVVDNALIVNESPVEDSDRFVSALTEELNIRNIESLVFYPDLTQDEFRVFLNCLKQEPDRFVAQGGVQAFLENEGITHVVANEVKYGKIKDSAAGEEGLDEAIVAAFLMGKMPVFRGDQKGFMALLEENPAKVGETINAGFAAMIERGEGEEKSGRVVHRAIEQVGRFLETQPGASEKQANIMGQIILALNPEVQAGLHAVRAAQADPPADRIDTLVSEFKDEEIIRLLCNVYQGGLQSPQILAKVASRVLPTLEQRERIASDLGQELMRLGMGSDAWERLRDDLLWAAYSAIHKVDRLATRNVWIKTDIDRIKEVGPELVKEKNGEAIHRLVKCLFRALQDSDAGIRNLAAGCLPEFYGLVEDSGRFNHVGLYFCQKLITRVQREPDEKVRESILLSLGLILRREILSENLQTAARAVLTLSRLGFLLQLIELCNPLVMQDVTERIITALSGDGDVRRREASVLLKLFGRTVLGSVLFALEREEDPDIRGQLMMIVKSMGAEVTSEIVHRLTDKRWYVVRCALSILGEMTDSSISPDLLTSSVYHDDIRVRKEAIKTLSKLKSKGAIKILCELLEEKDEELRLLALRSLGDAGDRVAVPHVLHLLKKRKSKGGKPDILRQTAIEVLGRIGDPEAIPPLLDLLRSKGFFKKEDDRIRRSVVEALGAFKVPELEETLQSVLQKDKDMGVREAAHRALLSLKTSGAKPAVEFGL